MRTTQEKILIDPDGDGYTHYVTGAAVTDLSVLATHWAGAHAIEWSLSVQLASTLATVTLRPDNSLTNMQGGLVYTDFGTAIGGSNNQAGVIVENATGDRERFVSNGSIQLAPNVGDRMYESRFVVSRNTTGAVGRSGLYTGAHLDPTVVFTEMRWTGNVVGGFGVGSWLKVWAVKDVKRGLYT